MTIDGSDLEAQIKAKSEELSKLQGQLRAAEKKTLVRCEEGNQGCGAGLEIGTLVYIQTQWYVEPRGCTEGDYWKDGEGQFECPICGLRNRLYWRKDIEARRGLFLGKVYASDDGMGNVPVNYSDQERFNTLMEQSRQFNKRFSKK